MSSESVILIVAGAISTVLTGCIVAWFVHRLNLSETAATNRDRDAREGLKSIKDELAAQSRTIAATGSVVAVVNSQIGPFGDRLIIAESGLHTLDTANQLLRQSLENHIEWTREQFRVTHSAG